MPMKPIKRHFKVWMRADSTNGYVSQFEFYTGKKGSTVEHGIDPLILFLLCVVSVKYVSSNTNDDLFLAQAKFPLLPKDVKDGIAIKLILRIPTDQILSVTQTIRLLIFAYLHTLVLPK